MLTFLNPPLSPRKGLMLLVALICRISTENQDERSLGDQESLLKQFIQSQYDGPIRFIVIKSQGSGEHLDRRELIELEEQIEDEQIDAVVAEDLGRICRRKRAYDFCELCEDHNVRLIALNDGVDTANDGWQDSAFISTWHHERSNRDTSDRIRRSLRNRFDQGGVFQVPIYGYLKPAAGASDAEISKDPAAEPIYNHWFDMLEKGAFFTEIADWLNAQSVPVGPGCRRKKWDGRMVGRVTRNPILKGVRRRNERMSKRVNKTGRRKSVKAPPEDRLERMCPHLAFIDPQRYDRVIQILEERNAKYRRSDENGEDTRRNVAKKRTRFPGQIIECGICGNDYVFGGHGQTDHLMCDGAREYHCWNGITVDGPLATRNITAAVLSEIESLPEFDQVFLQMVNEEARRIDADSSEREREFERQIDKLNRELDHLMNFVRSGHSSDRVAAEIQHAEAELDRCQRQLEDLRKQPSQTIKTPDIDDLKTIARQEITGPAAESWEFNRLMQRLIPKIVVFPHRLLDSNSFVLRASFRLHLSNLIENEQARDVLLQPLERILTVDLFEPPQPEAFREQVVALRQTGIDGVKKTEREVAAQLGITVTAAQRAAARQRRMDALGLHDPYVAIEEPSEDFGRLKRHKHPRYSFKPLPHAGQI